MIQVTGHDENYFSDMEISEMVIYENKEDCDL